MIALLAIPWAAVLFAMPLLALPVPAIAAIGAIGLLLLAAGLAVLWRALVTAAACVFLVNYTAALWLTGTAVDLAAAAAFGLALLGLLQTADLAGRARDSTVAFAVVRAQVGAFLGVGAATLGAVALALILAGSVATALPAAVAPLLATAGALGVVGVLAALIARGAAPAGRRAGDPAGRTSPALDGRRPPSDSVRRRAHEPGMRDEP